MLRSILVSNAEGCDISLFCFWMSLNLSETPVFVEPYHRLPFTAEKALAFYTGPADQLISCIDSGNKPSQAVAQRFGETRDPLQNIAIGGRTYTSGIWRIARADRLRQG